MLKVRNCGSKNGQNGYIKIYQDGELIVFIECNYLSPYQYAIKHKMGWFAKAIRQALLLKGIKPELCDYILKTGKYDPRNDKGHCTRPETLLSRTRSRNAKAQHKTRKALRKARR